MILFFIDAVFCLRFNLFMNFYGTMFLIMDKDLPQIAWLIYLTFKQNRMHYSVHPVYYDFKVNQSSIAACAAATRAIGTRNGEQDT